MISGITPYKTQQTFGTFVGQSREKIENALKEYYNKEKLPSRDVINLQRLENSPLNVSAFIRPENKIMVTIDEPVTGDTYGYITQTISPNFTENIKNVCIHSEIGARHYHF